ncbi:MAG: hypothetical protein DRI94_00775 [Bacteroidetes bacterium]|nr:MAG: hypothetical protein DRI94_00775 [Bacteroidota bacterium]
MKLKNIKYMIAVGAILLTISSCRKNFEDINTNPNNPTQTNPEYLFTYILKEGGGEYDMFTVNKSFLSQWIMYASKSFGNSTMPPYFYLTQQKIKGLWESFYTKILLNTNELLILTKDDPEAVNKYSLARIWKVYTFHKITDLWGNVPYSEALNSNILKPVYDNQEDIYSDMLNELGEAVAAIDYDKQSFSEDADILFHGDLDKWVKFANSLRLRLAIRSGNQSIVTELMNEDNFISNNNESANFYYPSSLDDRNPWFDYFENYETAIGQVSEFMVTKLQDLNDPRLPIYAQPTTVNTDTIIGMPNLLNVEEVVAFGYNYMNTSYPGLSFVADINAPNQLLSYSEVCFLKTEAALRSWGSSPAEAEQFYNDGVTASMQYNNIPDTEITNYLAGDAAFDGTLEQLITQKWIALYLNGFEAFAEYRRTSFPTLQKWDMELNGIIIVDTTLVTVDPETVPGRFPYPDNEPEFNSVNYNAAVEIQGPDNLYTKVWWATLNHNF